MCVCSLLRKVWNLRYIYVGGHRCTKAAIRATIRAAIADGQIALFNEDKISHLAFWDRKG